MRTTLDLPDPLFRSLKARAAMDGTSLKDLLVRLVQRGLAEPSPQLAAAPVRRSPFPVLVHGPLALPVEAMSSNAKLYDLMYAEEDAYSIALMRGTVPAGTTPADVAGPQDD
jgi:hypothetical protein